MKEKLISSLTAESVLLKKHRIWLVVLVRTKMNYMAKQQQMKKIAGA